VDGDFKTSGLAGHKTVATNVMLTSIDPRDMGWVTEGEVVDVDAGGSRCEEGKPKLQVQLDISGKGNVTVLGGAVLGCLNAAQKVVGLGDDEAAVVEAANEGVKVGVGDLAGVIGMVWMVAGQASTLCTGREMRRQRVSTFQPRIFSLRQG
jgi:hypothetical protein